MGFGLPSIGGKDSMSGTFEHIDVPPTLCSFAIDVAKEGDIITPELKNDGDVLVRFDIKKDQYDLPDFEQVKALYSQYMSLSRRRQSCLHMFLMLTDLYQHSARWHLVTSRIRDQCRC